MNSPGPGSRPRSGSGSRAGPGPSVLDDQLEPAPLQLVVIVLLHRTLHVTLRSELNHTEIEIQYRNIIHGDPDRSKKSILNRILIVFVAVEIAEIAIVTNSLGESPHFNLVSSISEAKSNNRSELVL